MITSSWASPVTTWTTHNHPIQLQVRLDGFSQFQVGFSWFSWCFFGYSRLQFGFWNHVFFYIFFQCSRLIFHGSRWVLRVIHGSRSVFIVPGWFFMVPGRFSWFQAGFCWFFNIPGWFFLVPGSFSWFLSFQVWFSWFQVDFYRH